MVLKVSAHVRRIEAVEKDLKALAETSASKDDIPRIRAEMKRLYDGLHVGKSWTCLMPSYCYIFVYFMKNSWTCDHMCGASVSQRFY